mgnify:CR=1 FL=1
MSQAEIRVRTAGRATLAALLSMGMASASVAGDAGQVTTAELAAQVKALTAQVEQLKASHPPPELGKQMLELQIRHARLWWAGQNGDWTLAYFMVGELTEALRGIEETNGDAPDMQPHKLSEIMPAMMNPAIKGMQQALAKQDKQAFAKAFDQLSTACTGCHQIAGAPFLVIQRPKTPLLDNLREKPAG